MAYAELHCLSHYSFLRAASSPAELVLQAAQLGYSAIAITDECSYAGLVKAWQASKQVNLKLISGSEFRCKQFGVFVLLAQNRQGYGQIGRFISQCRRAAEKGSYTFQAQNLLESDLSNCLLLWLPRFMQTAHANRQCATDGATATTAEFTTPSSASRNPIVELAQQLQAAFPQRCWLMYQRYLQPADRQHMQYLRQFSAITGWPIVATGGVRIHHRERLPLLHVLQAIRKHVPVAKLGFSRLANAEVSLRTLAELEQLLPAKWLAETEVIAQRCSFNLSELRYEYPAEVVPQGFTANGYLRQLGLQGLRWRYPNGVPKAIRAQLEKELTLVEELGYAHFFLTIHDVVVFARQQNILHQGRGSAANSVLCYCLGITAVNPAQSQLLFERFISRERNEPPDIDVDFEHERREEVIQYIYNKYGRNRAALAATVITYRLRSALRDVGKALGFPEAQIEQLLNRLDRRDSESDWRMQLQQMGVMNHPQGAHLLMLTEALLGFPRHLSQHVGGFVIAAGELADLVPIENAAMAERTVIQWDKDDIEALCLLKVDVLALGMLTAIRKTFALLPDFYGVHHSLASIPQDDPQVYRMLQKADSVGVFQIESRAQMNMLPRLKPNCFYDLVIQIAIVRPGPIQGDMVHPYLRRRAGKEAITYPNPAVEEVLKRTLGVPIFQEQVIKLAMVAAGFSGGEADALRRAMAIWRSKGKLMAFQEQLINGMRVRGYSQEFAERLFEQICGFGEYGFPESHSASFANLAYASSWLKCHYPAAFYVGLLNSQPMGFYTASQLIQDARRHHVEVLPISINSSTWNHALQPSADPQHAEVLSVSTETSAQPSAKGAKEPMIRLGFRLIKGLAHHELNRLLQHRPAAGFTDMQEFLQICEACGFSDRGKELLASANALAELSGNRYQTRWNLTTLREPNPQRQTEQLSLLNVHEQPMNEYALAAPNEFANMQEDYQFLGLTLGKHPLALLHELDVLPKHRTANDLPSLRSGQLVTAIGLVTNRQRPSTASGVTFLTLEDHTGTINVVLWQELARRQRKQWLKAQLLQVKGVLEIEGDVIHIVAGDLRDLTGQLPNAQVKSRDFH